MQLFADLSAIILGAGIGLGLVIGAVTLYDWVRGRLSNRKTRK